MKLYTDLFLLSPEPYINMVDTIWDLKDQVRTFEDPITAQSQDTFNAINSISLGSDNIVYQLNIIDYNNTDQVKIDEAFQGLNPHQVYYKKYLKQAGELFNCDYFEHEEIILHFVNIDLLKYLVIGSSLILKHWDNVPIRKAICTISSEKSVKAWLEYFSKIELNNEQVLIGWTYSF